MCDISTDTIQRDLTLEKPLWPLTSYGPAKHAPTIIQGLDESPEELRVKAVSALQSGSSAEYVSL